MTSAACPICDNVDITFFWAKQERELNICNVCRHVFWSVMPTPDVLAQYYATEYSGGHGQSEIQQTLRDYYRSHIVELGGAIGMPLAEITIADVGCSYPVFLEAAIEAGVGVALGVDWSPEARDYGAPRGIPVISPDEMLELIPDGSLDILRYSHTLEHLADPLGTLRLQSRKVRPGGIVYITQPNFPVFRFGPSTTDIHDSVWPTHLQFFSPLSLARLVAEAGLTVQKIISVTDPEYAQKQYASDIDLDYAREQLAGFADKGEVERGELNNYPNYFGLNSALYARVPNSPALEEEVERLSSERKQQDRTLDVTRMMLRLLRRQHERS